MSEMCLFVLRDARRSEETKKKLLDFAVAGGYGVWFDPINSLTMENKIDDVENCILFEATDAPDRFISSDLVGPDLYSMDGQIIGPPLLSRLHFLQELAGCSLQFSEKVDIFLSFDDAYLPDYATYDIPCDAVAETLYAEYEKVDFSPLLPCVHLIIHA